MEKITENFESVMLDSYLGLSYAVSNILHGSLLNQVGFLVLKENIQNFASKLSYDPPKFTSIYMTFLWGKRFTLSFRETNSENYFHGRK